MKNFRDVDDIANRYLELRESIASLPGINLVAASGVYCCNCGEGAPTNVKAGNVKKAGRWQWKTICSHCREPWQGAAMELLKRHVQTGSRPNLVERRMTSAIDDWRRVAPLVEKRAVVDVRGKPISPRRWDHGVIAWLAYSQTRWGTYRLVIEFGMANRDDMSDLWTEKRVRTGISRVRGVIRSRAISAGVMG